MPVVLDARVSPRLSLVAPCYNEEGNLRELVNRLRTATIFDDVDLRFLGRRLC